MIIDRLRKLICKPEPDLDIKEAMDSTIDILNMWKMVNYAADDLRREMAIELSEDILSRQKEHCTTIKIQVDIKP